MLFPGMGRLTENTVVNIKNKSHAVSAEVVVGEGDGGVIVAQGGAFGGWSLYLLEGRPVYCYNLLGLQRVKVAGQAPLSAGEHQVRMEFDYDGGGLGKGGAIGLYVDGEQVGEGRLEASVPLIFSADETTDIGSDGASPVSDDYGPQDSAFSGRVRWVRIDLGDDAKSADHLITPDERFRLAMARQ
jgi:arylsulfatase